MAIEELVRFAESQPLNKAVIEQACARENLSLQELYVAFACDVAVKYMNGVYSWGFGDEVMRKVFHYACPVTNTCLPEFAFKVFIAFDAGESHLRGESADPKSKTKALIAELMKEKDV